MRTPSPPPAQLPVYLRMRRMPLCDNKPWPGEPVIVAIPEGTARSRIMLPSLLPAQFQKRFSTVIRDVATTGNSGSGVFDAGQKCLLGIISLGDALEIATARLRASISGRRFMPSFPRNWIDY
jgi:hypothetical protein